MKKVLLCMTLLLTGVGIAMAQGKNGFPVQTKVQNGIIEGEYDTKSNIQSYLGVPFAQPPIGNLRWQAPRPLENWQGVKETKKFGPRPMQTVVFGDMNSWSDGVSEDCLYLNVWTPAKRNTTGLPVLVYFYGGGFVAGDGSEPRYNGESMAKKGIVAVTVNYRLNVFGFMAHPELSAEAPYKASGNYGLLDQALALQWVKDNIASFGGDPNKITIAGESAGSISVSYQMASPLSKNLIAGAIGESGAGINPTLAPVSLAEAEKKGIEFQKQAQVSSLAELRNLPARDIYEIYNESRNFGFPTVIDGYFLSKSLPEIFEAGEQAQVPLLLGWNSAEIPGGTFMQGKPYTQDNFITMVKQTYPQDYEEVLKLYPHRNAKEVEYAATDLASDRFIVYSTWKWFDLHRKNSDSAVYRYLFSKLRPPMVEPGLVAGLAGGTAKADDVPQALKAIGAPHAMEIEYAMGNLPLVNEFAWTKDDYKTSETMQNFFANFIKHGNPNGEGLAYWPNSEANDPNPPVMIIDSSSKVEKSAVDARYLFHEKFYGNKE